MLHHYTDIALTYDNDDTLLTKSVTSQDAELLAKWTYAYDDAGRITSQQLQGQSMAYTSSTTPTGSGPGTHGSLDDRTYAYDYDDAGRLTSFTQGTTSKTIKHDHNGNRTQFGSTTTEYNPDDTIHKSGTGSAHEYFPFGGHESDDCTTNGYDAFDRLVSVDTVASQACGPGISSDYSYDGLDRQRRQTGSINDGISTRNIAVDLHYDGLGDSLAVEWRTASDWTRYVLSPTGDPVGTMVPHDVFGALESAQIDDGNGNLGITVDFVDVGTTTGAREAVGCSARFDPYGDPVGPSDDRKNSCNTGETPSSRLYRGARRDPATGAYQFGSRTYVPGRAGFLTPDGYAAEGTGSTLGLSVDPLTRNSYTYVNGDPVNLYDPTGHGLRDWKKKLQNGFGNLVDAATSFGGFVVDATKQTVGVVKGFGEAVYESGKAAVQLAWTGAAATGLRGHAARVETWNKAKLLYEAVKSDPWGVGKAMVTSFADGIRNDWSNGNYGEAIGRGLFEAVSSLVSGGIVAKVSGVEFGRAANAVSGLGHTIADKVTSGVSKVLGSRAASRLTDHGPSIGDLRRARAKDAHHIIQDAAVRDVPGYDTNAAPGITLSGPSTAAGTPHYNATQVQRSAEVGGTYGAERQVACMALVAAGCSATEVAHAIARADAYFIDVLGLTMDSPLRVPGNRKVR